MRTGALHDPDGINRIVNDAKDRIAPRRKFHETLRAVSKNRFGSDEKSPRPM